MKEKIKKFLTIISFIIAILGIFLGIFSSFELIQDSTNYEKMYIDGSNFTNFFNVLGFIISICFGFVIIVYSFILIGALWILYGIILFIIKIIKKRTNKKKQT